MKRYLFLVLLFPLAGCSDARPQQLARCTSDAEIVYPQSTWLPGDDRQDYVWLCMSANGYALNRRQDGCARRSTAAPEAILHAQCYEPRAKFASVLFRLERVFGR